MTTQRGNAAVDCLATIAVVGILLVGLATLRPTKVGPEAPVDVIPPIVRLLGHPVQNLEPRPAQPSRPPRPRAPHPKQPRPAAPTTGPSMIPLPKWWSRP